MRVFLGIPVAQCTNLVWSIRLDYGTGESKLPWPSLDREHYHIL